MTTIEQTPFIDINVIENNIKTYAANSLVEQSDYEIKLKQKIKEGINDASKIGSNSFKFSSKFILSDEFKNEINPLQLRFIGEIYIDNPLSSSLKEIRVGYYYKCFYKKTI